MNFCRLPPERLLAPRRRGPPHLTLNCVDARLRERARPCANWISPRLTHAAAMRGEQRVVGERHLRHRAAAEPLLRARSRSRARAAAPASHAARRRCRRCTIALRVAHRRLAGERRQQLLLAVAGHAGDADDLAGAHGEIDVRRATCRTDRRRLPRETARATSASARRACASPCCGCGRSLPIIIRASVVGVSLRGSQCR